MNASANQPIGSPVTDGSVISPWVFALIQSSMPGVSSTYARTPASMPSANAMPSLRPVAIAAMDVPGQ